ncbi:MAG: hypothetical protein M3Y72_02415, partial [Acidobacteriota bacterium]|nr:hypothetical protein [Acidobacteriota bacterium]
MTTRVIYLVSITLTLGLSADEPSVAAKVHNRAAELKATVSSPPTIAPPVVQPKAMVTNADDTGFSVDANSFKRNAISAELKSFVCDERIERHKGRRDKSLSNYV